MPLSHPAKVSSPLGEDVLRLRRMSGREELGRPFQFDLELLSEQEVQPKELLGKSMTVHLELPDDELRHFDGYVSRFARVGTVGRDVAYRATLRPRLWQLSRTSDCKVFQHMTVPDVIKQVLRQFGFDDFEEALSQTYRSNDYIVQYRESALQFITRLMEREGIYYFFKHEPGRHILVLADSYSSHQAAPGYEEIPYFPPNESERRERDHLDAWNMVHQVETGAIALNDFDFEKPRAGLEAKLSAAADGQPFEVYDYPGTYSEPDHGEFYARVRLEELQSQVAQFDASGNARGLAAGGLFKLSGHTREDQNREYLITGASYTIEPNEYETGTAQSQLYAQLGIERTLAKKASSSQAMVFRSNVSAIESLTPFRLPRSTPRPTLGGPQTAIVVGKAGEDIWTDAHGRVKVQFHWDRSGASDENSSCWVRVAHIWAGSGFGGVFIPRIGQEVIVDFLEGDPDRPIITGRVYNAENMPPYELPTNQTQSGIKTRSSPGGNPDEANELRFEDKKGAEEVYLHAQKNLTEAVNAAHNLTVGADQSYTVGGSQTTTVSGSQTDSVSGSQSVSVSGSRTVSVTGANTVSVDGAQTITVKGGETATIMAQRTEMVMGAKTEAVVGVRSVDVAGMNTETYKAGRTMTVTGMDLITADNRTDHVLGTCNLTADTTLALAQGAATLTLDSSKILLAGAGHHLNLDSNELLLDAIGKVTIQQGGRSVVVDGTTVTLSNGASQIVVKPTSIDITSEHITINGQQLHLNC